MNSRDVWRSIIAENRAGKPRGIASWCTAHPQTLSAVLAAHRDGDDPILIEATCNQVNQHGGYTGMTPAAFRTFIKRLAREEGVDSARIILGGDHLGPNPWKGQPAMDAMREARDMVRAYVEAGFSKISSRRQHAMRGRPRLVGTDDRRTRGGALRRRGSGERRRGSRLCHRDGGSHSGGRDPGARTRWR